MTRMQRALWASALALSLACGASEAIEIQVASIAPDGSRWMQEMRAGAEQISLSTGGRVAIKFYPGGVMGNDAQVLRKVRVGQLQGGAFTAGGLSERYHALGIYGVPLLFRSLQEVDAVRTALDPKLQAGLADAGFVSFGFIEGGFANLMANYPIHSVEDLKRRKIWVPEGDQISFLAMETLGLSPVVLPVTDVLPGLQTGLLDVAAASPVATLVLQWQTKVKYVTDLPVSYSMGIFAIDRAVFERLDAADQMTVREVMGRVARELDHVAREDERQARIVMQKSGLQYVSVNPSDVAEWRRTVEGIYPALRQRSDFDAPMFDELLAVLARYRAEHGESP
jgi:TRAP-type C4-dicarboxylate transport system substrate-binding protein